MRFTCRALTIISLFTVLFSLSCSIKKSELILTVYTYDSFISEWGAGLKIAEEFEKTTGIKVQFVAKGDGGNLLSTIISEKGKKTCDVLLGIDNQLASRLLSEKLLASYKPAGLDAIPAELKIDPDNTLVPYDFGHFAILWDSDKLKNPPASLSDLIRPEYARKLIIMDPRTSTPGLGLLSWVKAVYGNEWETYWKALRVSTLTMTPGWDAGYGLFTSGEAPLVVSYTTSPAYHKEYDKTDRYRALLFPEGHPVQIEFAGIVADAPHKKNAEKFMDFLISPACQSIIPTTQWMYPANTGIPLPDSYSTAPKPTKTLVLPLDGMSDEATRAAEIMNGAHL